MRVRVRVAKVVSMLLRDAKPKRGRTPMMDGQRTRDVPRFQRLEALRGGR
jgi:hypothetical protein